LLLERAASVVKYQQVDNITAFCDVNVSNILLLLLTLYGKSYTFLSKCVSQDIQLYLLCKFHIVKFQMIAIKILQINCWGTWIWAIRFSHDTLCQSGKQNSMVSRSDWNS